MSVNSSGRGVALTTYLQLVALYEWLHGVDSKNFAFLRTQRLFEGRICIRYILSDYFFMITPGLRCGIYLQQVFAGIFVLLIFAIKCYYIWVKFRIIDVIYRIVMPNPWIWHFYWLPSWYRHSLLELLFECVLMTFFSVHVGLSFENFVIFLRTLFWNFCNLLDDRLQYSPRRGWHILIWKEKGFTENIKLISVVGDLLNTLASSGHIAITTSLPFLFNGISLTYT